MAIGITEIGSIIGIGQPTAGNNATPTLQVDRSIPAVLCVLDDTGTNGVTQVMRIIHRTSGTPAAGFGVEITFKLHDSLNVEQVSGRIQSDWTTATSTSQSSEMTFSTVNAGTPTKWLSLSGAGVLGVLGSLAVTGNVGFFGAATVGQQTNASAAGIATVADAPAKAALTAIRTALINLGLAAATA